jgi:DnaJ-class molecular chaperone
MTYNSTTTQNDRRHRMTTTPTDYITDPDEPCRRCGGLGYEIERLEGGRTTTEPCDLCGGSGAESVVLKRTFATFGGEAV